MSQSRILVIVLSIWPVRFHGRLGKRLTTHDKYHSSHNFHSYKRTLGTGTQFHNLDADMPSQQQYYLIIAYYWYYCWCQFQTHRTCYWGVWHGRSHSRAGGVSPNLCCETLSLLELQYQIQSLVTSKILITHHRVFGKQCVFLAKMFSFEQCKFIFVDIIISWLTINSFI